MKIIRSLRDAKGNLIQKQPTGGVGRQRCMKCQSLCVPSKLNNGATVMQCRGCGATYVCRALDAPKRTSAIKPQRPPPTTNAIPQRMRARKPGTRPAVAKRPVR